jgi:hypothetical protein
MRTMTANEDPTISCNKVSLSRRPIACAGRPNVRTAGCRHT